MFFEGTNRRWAALLLVGALATAGLAGCHSEDDKAAKAAEEALGVKDSKSETKPKQVIVKDIEQVIDPQTNKVLRETEKETPVTVQVQVEQDVKADVGETRTQTPKK